MCTYLYWKKIRHKTWLTGTIHTSSQRGLLKWFWVDFIMNSIWTSPFFIIDTGNVFTWLTVIHYNSVSCFPCEIVTLDETHYIWNDVLLLGLNTNGNLLPQALLTTWGIFLLNHNPQYDSQLCHEKQI